MSPVDYPARPRRERERHPRPPAGGIRAFGAVFPPASVLRALEDLRDRMESAVPGLRWVRADNLHFTLRFFGEITSAEAERAGVVLDEVARRTVPFELELSGMGVFPSWKRPRVLWVGSGQGGPVLEALARTLERGFRDARLGKSDKKFVPHLTVGRWRDAGGMDLVGAESACEEVGIVGSFPVEEVSVIQSRLGPRGSTYTRLHTSRLVAST